MNSKIIHVLLLISSFLPALASAQNTPHAVSADSVYTLREVVVTGSRVPVGRDMIPVPVSVINRSVIERSEESNLLPALMKHVPGLFVTSRGVAGYGVSGGSAGGINLRGFSGGAGRVLILIDGHPQYATVFGHPVADAYLSSEAQRVEVSRGAASILYGSNAMGGAINIITRAATEEGNSLSARAMGGSYGTVRLSATDNYRGGKFSATASANYERTDGHRRNMNFDTRSGYAKLGYELSGRWKVTGNVSVSHFHAQNPGSTGSPLLDAEADVLRGMSGLSVENDYGITRGAVNFYYSWGKHKINDGHAPEASPREYRFRSTDYMGGVNIYQSVGLFKGNTLTGGFDVKLYGGDAYRNPVTEIYADDINLREIAGYLFAQQEFGRFMLNAGIRLENHELYGDEWIPQGGISYRVAGGTHLKFSVSKGFRTPNFRELYMYPNSNEELRPESSTGYDFTVAHALPGNRMQMELTLFYMEGSNIIESIAIGNNLSQYRNVGEFINKGIEFSANGRLTGNLHLHGNYSYLHMSRSITGAPRHKLYAGLLYNPGRFSFSLGTQVISKLYTVTDADNTRTSSYTLADARVSYRVMRQADIFVKGDNLLARRYETMSGYPMPRATFMAGVSMNL